MSWKENSHVITASISAAAAIAFAIGVYEQALIPTRIASTTNELTETKRRLEKITATNLEKKSQLALLSSELKRTKKQLTDAINSALFQHNNPYPKGAGKVRIGDNANSIVETYEKERVYTKTPSYYSVTLEGLISGATYYFNEDDNEKIITHILFTLNYIPQDDESSLLQPLLEEALGQPSELSRERYFFWKTQNTNVFKDSERSYLVMAPSYVPGSWPAKLQDEVINILQTSAR